MNMDVHHDTKSQRFYVTIAGEEGELRYRTIDSTTLDFYSTFVPPTLRNQGIAEKIVCTALEYAKEHRLHIVPTCSYVKSYIDRHMEYEDVLVK